MKATVVIPVLARPASAEPVLRSVLTSSPANVIFVCSADDRAEIRAVRKLQSRYDRCGLLIVDGPGGQRGDYARKVNLAMGQIDDWFFQGADDLVFHDGWLDACEHAHDMTGCRVIGTRDGCNARTSGGRHSTHSLIHISYVRDYGPPLHEGYWHNFVDDELVTLAKWRREFAWTADAFVEHVHPNCRDIERDGTYERALDRFEFAADRRIFNRRLREYRRRPSPRRRRAARV